MPLTLTVDQLPSGVAVVVLTGPLTLGTNLRMADNQVQALLAKGVKHLVLDMTGVPYCDSAGLGMLVHTFGLAQQNGGSLRLCCLSERVAALLGMTTTDKFLPIDASREASLAAMA